MIELDAIDRKLILALVQDASQSASALGRAFGLSQPATWRRIKRLEEAGVLKGRQLRLDAQMLGFGVTVFLGVKLATKGRVSLDDFERAVVAIPEVIEVQTFLGRVDVRLSIIARDMTHYQQVYRDQILTLPHIADIEALMHVARIKSQEVLPL